MNDERKSSHSVRRRLTPEEVLVMAVQVTLLMAVVWYRPLARLGLADFEARHGAWPEFVAAGVLLVLVRTAYLRFFRRAQTREEIAALREDIRSGRMKRMSLAARCVWLLLALGLLSGGTLMGPGGQGLLVIGVPMFLLFVAAELAVVLYPGNSLMPDPHDELLMFFKAKMLQVGYCTAILSLAVLYVVSLFGTRYLGLLVAVVLALSLMVPAFAYRQLDRRAGPDE
jgi:hypothetical protein